MKKVLLSIIALLFISISYADGIHCYVGSWIDEKQRFVHKQENGMKFNYRYDIWNDTKETITVTIEMLAQAKDKKSRWQEYDKFNITLKPGEQSGDKSFNKEVRVYPKDGNYLSADVRTTASCGAESIVFQRFKIYDKVIKEVSHG